MANEEKNQEILKSKFLNIFAAIPINLRNEIVAIFDNEPLSWSAVYVEVLGNSKKANKILKSIQDLGLLGD